MEKGGKGVGKKKAHFPLFFLIRRLKSWNGILGTFTHFSSLQTLSEDKLRSCPEGKRMSGEGIQRQFEGGYRIGTLPHHHGAASTAASFDRMIIKVGLGPRHPWKGGGGIPAAMMRCDVGRETERTVLAHRS